MMGLGKIKVMLVDDQMLLREGLKTIINLQDDMEVVCEAENGEAAVSQVRENPADVILMDIRMPVLNGVEATRIIKQQHPGTAIIILTTFDDDDYIIDALSQGADGYLLKDIGGLHLVRAIQDAYRGNMMMPARIASKLALRLSGQKSGSAAQALESPIPGKLLTEREEQIAQLLAQEMGNRHIARKLFLSEGTVKNYISEIYRKLGTSNREQAAMLIRQMYEQ
jgi:DNA-binding NarL/FixJ family response regulator